MTMTIMPQGRQRYYDNDGILAVGCLLYTYASGTSTPKVAYQDSAGTVPHANPIVLDAKGEAVIYWSGTYKVDLKTALGVQITGWPVDNIATAITPADLSISAGSGLIGFDYSSSYYAGTIGRWLKDLALSTGAGFIGWIRSATGAVFRYVSDKLSERTSVKDFGATGDGTTNDYAAIVLAITYCALTGKDLFFPAGVYNIGANTITWSNGIRYFGESINVLNTKGSVILYSGTNDATQISNPINASTWAGITFNNLTFVSSTMAAGKALLYDTGSSYLYIEKCKFNVAGAGSYAIVLDQTEICKIDSNVIEATGNTGTGSLVWISNGATPKNPTGQTFFTNRITFTNNQVNPALGGANAIGLLDDGGIIHTIDDNNFNAGKYCLQVTQAEGLSIKRNEIEGATTFGIAFTAAASGAISVDISDNVYGGNVPFLSLASGAIDRLTYNNNTLDQGAVVAAESGLSAGVTTKISATQNRQRGIGNQPFNNYLQRNADTVGTVTLYGATAAGANTYSSQLITWRTIGDICFFNINIVMTAKDAAMSGAVRISGLPFASKTSSNGATQCAVGSVSNIGLDAGYTQYTALILAGNNFINLQESKAATANANIDASLIVATSAINISGIYAI